MDNLKELIEGTSENSVASEEFLELSLTGTVRNYTDRDPDFTMSDTIQNQRNIAVYVQEKFEEKNLNTFSYSFRDRIFKILTLVVINQLGFKISKANFLNVEMTLFEFIVQHFDCEEIYFETLEVLNDYFYNSILNKKHPFVKSLKRYLRVTASGGDIPLLTPSKLPNRIHFGNNNLIQVEFAFIGEELDLCLLDWTFLRDLQDAQDKIDQMQHYALVLKSKIGNSRFSLCTITIDVKGKLNEFGFEASEIYSDSPNHQVLLYKVKPNYWSTLTNKQLCEVIPETCNVFSV
jgi:hypothetical protein